MTTRLLDVAEELYDLPPGDFVAARNARAKALRTSGERNVATRVAKLARPSTGAWASNLLARQRPGEIDRLLTLGDALRDAQTDLDPDALRSLAVQRRTVVAALAKEAAQLAERSGSALGPAALAELEQTLQAALSDAAAAEAVRSGRLVRALSGTGFEEVDLADAVAVPQPRDGASRPRTRGTEAARASQSPPQQPREGGNDERERRRERERAELAEAVGAAERTESKTKSTLRDAEDALWATSARRDRTRLQVSQLQSELARAETALASASTEAKALESDRQDAFRAAERAKLLADRARAKLRRAG